MFKKILIANRGEIATRVIRAAKELDIKTVAIYSEEDATALYIKKADEAYTVGPGPIKGFLNIHKIVDLAKEVGADAIHPGYGFLSENAKFAELCEKKGIAFIGPKSQSILDMGDKITARNIMQKAGVPIVPGMDEPVESAEQAKTIADEFGYPVMIKASGGGGGRGLRPCFESKDFINLFNIAQKEAESSFGNSEIFIEKLIENPHHIEIQILADSHGNIIHLGERDCSIQRRNQKLVEIAPSLILDDKTRKAMAEAAIKAAKATDYVNAGTIEFLVDKDLNFYFLEMNTRIQVEHPVTEEVTGVDLVRQQIRIAAGKKLTIKQSNIKMNGFSIECRICVEDPKNNFMPNSGVVTAYYSPGGIGVRIDGALYKGYKVPDCYDSMVIKLIVHARKWPEAVARMKRALDEFTIRGVKTTIPYHLMIMDDEDFKNGNFDTGYIESKPELLEYEEVKEATDIVAAISAAIAAHHGF